MEKRILVIGATGHQGGAVVRQLLRNDFKVKAFTRDPLGTKALPLIDLGVELVKGGMDDYNSLLDAMRDVYGVFCAINMMDGGVHKEEERGRNVAGAVKQTGVLQYIYSSVGGADRDSGVPHFESKWHIEQYIQVLGIPHTIVRPVAFMENFFFGPPSLSLTVLRSVLGDKKIQLIAVEDIGKWVANAFLHPDAYMGHAFEIAGDELDCRQIQDAFVRVTGKKPWAVPLPGVLFEKTIGDFGKMLTWFREHGFKADIRKFRETIKDSLTFEKYLLEKQRLSSATRFHGPSIFGHGTKGPQVPRPV